MDRLVVKKLSLNERLADGLARRFYKSVKSHTRKAVTTVAFYGEPDSFDDIFSEVIENVTNVRSKKSAIQNIKRNFSLFFFACEEQLNLMDGRKLHSISINGFFVSQGLVLCNNTLIHLKKPQKSVGFNFFIGFTIHSISRILLRMKPEKLEVALHRIARLLTHTLQLRGGSSNVPMKNNSETWIYFKHVGGFLLKCEGTRVSVITFVSWEIFRKEQEALGERELIEMLTSERDAAEMVYELVVGIVKNRVSSVVSIPRSGHNF
jgi:hypothetical protein